MTVRRWNSSWKEGSTGRRRLIGAKIPQKSVANPRCGIHLVNPRSSQSPSNWPECVFLENVVFFEIGRSGGFQESELRARRGGANAAQFSWTPSQDNSLAKQSFQEIFSSLILKMSGLTLRGRRVCEHLHSVKLRGVKLESLLRFIFTCSGSRSLHLSNHKNCLLNKDQYFHIFGVMDEICFCCCMGALVCLVKHDG